MPAPYSRSPARSSSPIAHPGDPRRSIARPQNPNSRARPCPLTCPPPAAVLLPKASLAATAARLDARGPSPHTRLATSPLLDRLPRSQSYRSLVPLGLDESMPAAPPAYSFRAGRTRTATHVSRPAVPDHIRIQRQWPDGHTHTMTMLPCTSSRALNAPSAARDGSAFGPSSSSRDT